MAATRTSHIGPRAALAGDGGLFTGALFGLALGLAVTLGSGAHASNVAAGILLAAALALGPLLAWRLQGRRVDAVATGGAVLGCVAGGAAVVFLLLMTALLAWAGEAAGLLDSGRGVWTAPALVVGGAVAVIALALALALDVEAVRDLAPTRRAFVPLDVTRLAATLVYVAYVAAVCVWASGSSDVSTVDLLVFLTGPAVVGAVVVTVADAAVRRGARRTRGRLVSMG